MKFDLNTLKIKYPQITRSIYNSVAMKIYHRIKRFLDLLMGAIFLIALVPILIIISVIIKFDSPGPIMFRQFRVTKNCRLFKMYKFRTMTHEEGEFAGRSGIIYQGETLEESNARYSRTIINDPRITRVGKFLRQSHLDELPQLFNIVKGDISFVGPRPDVPAQQIEYEPIHWEKRHSVPAGLTGLAQIEAPVTPAERTTLDLFYVEKANLKLDFKILFSTVLKILKLNSF